MFKNKRIAIVYDWIDKWGGAERILLHLSKIFPQAVFYTSYVNYKDIHWAKDLNIKTSFLQNFPNFIKKNRLLSLPLYPYAFESFDFKEYDLVISLTSSFAKAIITKPETIHFCYLLTPTRFLWSFQDMYLEKYKILMPYIKKLKKWDLLAAQRPDKIISISKVVADRCLKYYKRKSEIIYPPFETEYWKKIKSRINNRKSKLKNKNYYLVVSRLEPYKKVDLVVQSFNQLNKYLIIVGTGTCESKLKKMAKKNITFLKGLTDQELGELYMKAKALIMPQKEDFGYTAVEAQFFNLPVIAFKNSGVAEIIIEGKSGIFFDKQNKESLIRALETFEGKSYNFKEEIIKRFSKENFDKSFKENLNKLLINNSR